jgi:hypothetical protein
VVRAVGLAVGLEDVGVGDVGVEAVDVGVVMERKPSGLQRQRLGVW